MGHNIIYYNKWIKARISILIMKISKSCIITEGRKEDLAERNQCLKRSYESIFKALLKGFVRLTGLGGFLKLEFHSQVETDNKKKETTV